MSAVFSCLVYRCLGIWWACALEILCFLRCIPYRERKFPGTSSGEGGKEVVHLLTKYKFRAHDMPLYN